MVGINKCRSVSILLDLFVQFHHLILLGLLFAFSVVAAGVVVCTLLPVGRVALGVHFVVLCRVRGKLTLMEHVRFEVRIHVCVRVVSAASVAALL